MKKCPYCAEEVLNEARKCKYCGESLVDRDYENQEKNRKALAFLGWVIAIIIGISFFANGAWYVPVSALALWVIWKSLPLPEKQRYIATGAVAVFFFVMMGVTSHNNRPPSIVLAAPEDGVTVGTEKITVSGTVSPKNSGVSINGTAVTPSGGSFSYDAPLPDEKNAVTVAATNGGNTVSVIRTINRTFAPEEMAARAKAEAEAKKAAEAAAAKTKAAEATWAQSKAGKLCKAHSTIPKPWTREECQDIAAGKVWIGMTYEMLLSVAGRKPDSINPSNYGNGSRYQYCWSGRSISCFYDENADGIIDAYN